MPNKSAVRVPKSNAAASVDLMLAEEFDAITVQHLIERANVGRTTFYAHFRNTDDLLLSDAVRFSSMLEHLAKMIARRIAALVPDVSALSVPILVASRMYAGALVELVRWSLDREATPSPAWVDARYHEVVWLGLKGTSA